MSGKLKEVRIRMKSVKSTQQITKAMKMVSAAKLRKATDSIVQIRPYADKLKEILTHILTNLKGDVNTSFGRKREVENALIVVVTSNRGLCGAFNTNIIKNAVDLIENKYASQRSEGNLHIMPIGKKGNDFLKRRYSDCTIIDDYIDLFKDLSFDQTSIVPQMIMDAFEASTYDVVQVIYGQFKNAATQFPVTVQYLPVPRIEKKEKKKRRADYIFEPEKDSLLETLIPNILKIQFQKFLLDTQASEHGARMTAMDKATENAEELLKELRINYNKARQEAITSELSEIVGGAAALEG